MAFSKKMKVRPFYCLIIIVLILCITKCFADDDDIEWMLSDSSDMFLRNDGKSKITTATATTFSNVSSRSINSGSNFARRDRGNMKKTKNALNVQENSSHRHHRRPGKVQRQQRMNKNALRLLSGAPDNIEGGGAFPPLFNIAPRAAIAVNATCGQNGREEYCKLVDAYPHKTWATQCGICNNHGLDLEKQHPIESVLNSSSGWWQSPTLRNGHQFEYVTITLDLKQVYEVFFVMLKAAISPRPSSWILERSLDNITYIPWQYFGLSDADCRRRYGLPGQNGKYIFQSNTEVICTTQFSKPMPLENGEIHVSLLKNRPGAMDFPSNLTDFITARYIRIRLQGMHSTVNSDNSVDWLLDSVSLEKRSFYSLKQIRISGRLACHGHANKSLELALNDRGESIVECSCLHNTCGLDCGHCCPLFNKRKFQKGTFYSENSCEKCQCYGHATACEYDEISGPVCLDCANSTTGNNCEECLPKHYRHQNAPLEEPCQKCNCNENPCDPKTGECICREGFKGAQCESCAQGYRGLNCTKCGCDARGTMPGGECEDHCRCKLFAEGETCSQCALGYFGLGYDNPDGCIKCFCSGVGISCRSASIDVKSFETLDEWKMTDISRSTLAYPTLDEETGNLVFGMFDLPGIEAVFWLAPDSYGGNKVTSYDSKLIVKVSWVIMRGDTSGKPTSGPSVILVGRNGMKIAYGDQEFSTSSAVIEVTLAESGWYHVPKTVKDIVTRLRRTEYRGDPVTRMQFMSVLSDVEAVLVRGTFHTDQVESVLEGAVLYSGLSGADGDVLSLVEECLCPDGYTGLSCEKCDFGYVRIYENTSAHEVIGKCVQCPCNGHAEFCDVNEGVCGECHHNTFGERCERCKVGFFGNPTHGTARDCQRCACPLLEDSNNFSPSCQLKRLILDKTFFEIEDNEYVCTQCPPGYTGDHCEVCDDGFYGNPTVLGSKCLPCTCNGGPCDILTGECITCEGNTEGWRCERCKPGFWGNPLLGCEPCDCYNEGSTSEVCDLATGQCECKPRFSSQKCDKCDFGYADIDLRCLPCDCNVNGSLYSDCDPDNGQCSCKLGVEGVKCDQCQDEYFGLAIDGCEECHCNPFGSIGTLCDRYSGQCACLKNVTGRRCDKCRTGSWNMTAGIGCTDCQCDFMGSRTMDCSPWTGQCDCKIGVGGRKCDQCLDGFYGLSPNGCKRCDLCPSEGHVCDPDTGRCVCPINSNGPDCLQCIPGSWGWQPKLGCVKCGCDTLGSIGQACDAISGQCICREGYAGRRCDTCAKGYFGYPDCKRCGCNSAGTIPESDGLVQCDSRGQCPCKELATGLKCDSCMEGSFGITKQNPRGCTPCFCFGRSRTCEQSDLSWGHIRMVGARNLSVQYIQPAIVPQRDYEYIVVIQMEGTRSYQEDAKISLMNGLNLIPSSTGNVSIGAYTTFYHPLYFQLPPQFYGDRTSSYGGYLRFNLLTDGCNTQLDRQILLNYPVAQIHAHNKLVLDYFQDTTEELAGNETFIIPLQETYWRYHHNRHEISRAVMMTALQNVRHIFLRGTSWADFTEVVLYNVHMDSAIYLSGATNNIARGVEVCECPRKFEGYSCQDPGPGYYRWRNQTDGEHVFMDDLIGRAIPCECSGRSSICDKETGLCLNCTENTGGNHCEQCAEGYYGDPNFGGCNPCPCPETSRNYAKGCTVWLGQISCVCKPGYTGPLCDRCAQGYFGTLTRHHGTCEPCDCNLDGIASNECNQETGQCDCKPGVIGRQCDICEAERHYLEDRMCKICDNCSLILMDYVASISNQLRKGVAHLDLSGIPPPWMKLQGIEKNSTEIESFLEDFMRTKYQLEHYDTAAIDKLLAFAEFNKIQWRKSEEDTTNITRMSEHSRIDALDVLQKERLIHNEIRTSINEINSWERKESAINIPDAYETASRYLEEIKHRANSFQTMETTWKCAFDQLYFYGNISDIIQDQSVSLEIFWKNLKTTNSRLSDLQVNVDQINESVLDAKDRLTHVQTIKSYLVEDYGDILERKYEIQQHLNNSYVSEAETTIVMIEDGLGEVASNIENMKNLRNILRETMNENEDLRKDVKKHWVPKAWRYANRSADEAKKYARQFQQFKDNARIPLFARSAYENISTIVEAARQATQDAQDRVTISLEKLYPSEGQSVIDRSKISLGKSKVLQKDAMQEMEKISNLKAILEQQQNKVESIKSTIWQAGLKNNNISASLELLSNKPHMNSVRESLDLANKISDEMRTESRKASDIKPDIYKLRQKFATLEPEWDTKLGLAEENISQTLSNIRMVNSSLSNIEKHSHEGNLKFQVWNNTVSRQLQELKDKIARARHAAQGIKISLESLKEKCVRSYSTPTIGLSTSNTIKLSLALTNKNGNSPLLFIEGMDKKFIALEMYRRKIRLVWNLGGKTGVVEHPLEIHTRDPKLDDAWYHIEANRTLNIGSLTVRRMTNNGTLSQSNPVSTYTNLEFTRFFRSTSNQIWLGKVPDDLRPRELQANPGLNVVIHQVSVDNFPLGIWNFIRSEGECGGAIVGAQVTADASNIRHFSGTGYAEVKKFRPRPYRKNLFALQMAFKTLDENALLFLAVDSKNNRSVSVTLSGGRIIFRIDYGDESKLEINTTKKYNAGKWVRIEAAREYVPKRGTENGSLKVDNEEPLTGSPTKPVTAQILPDLSKAVYYLGGVPPGFRSGITKAPGADNPFMGCMVDVQINGEAYDPLGSSSFFGVQQGCKESITKSGFYGDGYIELPAQSLRKRANIGFVLRTLQPECLILLSAFPPHISEEYDARDLKGNYSISLIDGHVNVQMGTGRSSIQIISNKTINDGEYHVINVIKTGRKIDLMIDDELQGTKSLSGTPTIINMPKGSGGLFFGGAPNISDYKMIVPTFVGFIGAIRDIVFNNKTVAFSDAVSFYNVQIGRTGPAMGKSSISDIFINTEPIGRSFAANPEGCQMVGSYSYEPNAFKFGDGPHSHSQLNIPVRRFWQKNFLIKFDFRTFYPNGVILIAPGTKEKQKHFVSLLLKDGHLMLIVRGRRKEELNLTAKLNDGNWHQVTITCQERKVTMSVEIGTTEQKTSAQMKIPKKISASNMIFIGGLPQNSISLPQELVMKLEGFKGCIRKMNINNATQDLARPDKHLNVGQCFPRVEKGSYFPGDAYAVYKKNFHVGKYLELELEFRTSELNGILLSVSEPVGFPALSLEINNGNVIFSCDLGDGNPFRVESTFPSKYAICDNKWHNISALYDYEQIALRIDNNPAPHTFAQNPVTGKVHTKSALYIGGLPDTAPSGTLLSRDNFKGCIRNVSIRNERRDWVDMDSLHNVLLSECLAIN